MVDLGRSVVQILTAHGQVAGVGFLVTEDLVVTSVHTLIDTDPQSRPEVTFELTGQAGRVLVPHQSGVVKVAVPQLRGRAITASVLSQHQLVGSDGADGCVLLRLHRIPRGLEPVRLDGGEPSADPGNQALDDVRVFEQDQMDPASEDRSPQLVLVGGFTERSRSRSSADVRTVRGTLGPPGPGGLRRLRGLDDMTGVWLGAPVLDEAGGGVVGLVSRFAGRGRMGEQATADVTPISGLAQGLPTSPHPWVRHHRVLLGCLAAGLVATLAVVMGLLRPGAAAHDREVSRQLAAVSNGLGISDPLKPLLAAAALSYAPTPQALTIAGQLLQQPSVALRGHTGTVDDVVYSPDGRTLATAGTDGSVRLWDLRTHRQLGGSIVEPGALLDIVTGAAFSPDGQAIATSQFAGTVRLRDVLTRAQIGSVITPLAGPGRKDQTLSLAFSPDGTILATGGTQGSVRLWDVGTHRPRGDPLQDVSFDAVDSIAFSPDGAIVATGLSDGTARLWAMATRRPQGAAIRGHIEAVRSVAFSPDGTLLATAGADGTAKLWDTGSHRLQATLRPRSGATTGGGPADGGAINGVAFTPDSAEAATGQGDGTVRLWTLDGRQREVLDAGSGQVVSVAFSPDGRQLAAAGDLGVVRLWDVRPSGDGDPPAPGSPAPESPHSPGSPADPAAGPGRMIHALCEAAGRPITEPEWRATVPDEPYRQVCPELPSQPPS